MYVYMEYINILEWTLLPTSEVYLASKGSEMEEVFKNLSNFSSTTTNQGLRNPGFAAFLIAIAIPLVVVFVFNGLIAIVLLRSTSVAVRV